MGLVLVAFGILGLIDQIGFFDTGGDTVAGLNTNGALSVLSIVVGVLLFAGMVIGGNFASTLNIVFGVPVPAERLRESGSAADGRELPRLRDPERAVQLHRRTDAAGVRDVRAGQRRPAARQPVLARPAPGGGGTARPQAAAPAVRRGGSTPGGARRDRRRTRPCGGRWHQREQWEQRRQWGRRHAASATRRAARGRAWARGRARRSADCRGGARGWAFPPPSGRPPPSAGASTGRLARGQGRGRGGDGREAETRTGTGAGTGQGRTRIAP